MENPATWTAEHYRIAQLLHTDLEAKLAIHKFLQSIGRVCTIDELQECMNTHANDVKNGVCGLSIESFILKTFPCQIGK